MVHGLDQESEWTKRTIDMGEIDYSTGKPIGWWKRNGHVVITIVTVMLTITVVLAVILPNGSR